MFMISIIRCSIITL